MARSSDFREARMALHDVQQQFLRKGSTDPVSVEAAVKAMNDHLQDLARLVRKRRIWTGVKHAFFFGQLGVDIVLGPLNPAAFGKAAISLGQFSASMMLPDPNRPEQVRAGGALLLVAQDRLGLTVSGERRPRRSRPRR